MNNKIIRLHVSHVIQVDFHINVVDGLRGITRIRVNDCITVDRHDIDGVRGDARRHRRQRLEIDRLIVAVQPKNC